MLTLTSPRYDNMKDTLPPLELPEKEHGAGTFLARGFHHCKPFQPIYQNLQEKYFFSYR